MSQCSSVMAGVFNESYRKEWWRYGWEHWQHNIGMLKASGRPGQTVLSILMRTGTWVQRLRGVKGGEWNWLLCCYSNIVVFPSYVIPATGPKEREASRCMIHEDYSLKVKTLCNYHQGPESLMNLSVQWGFFCVWNCRRCCGRRQEKCMMSGLPLKNV